MLSVEPALLGPTAIAGRIADVEVLIRTSQQQLLVGSFRTVTDAIKYLLDFQTDKKRLEF
ncbi:MAG: hypothetical protein NZ951_02765 [Dehalococcoidia bacterium]|nr:hypothetical protein [Dehalococcoidia bacterium]MDW8120072.1 hypothetical protein [Chloroflexota bacterium]